MPTLFTQIIRGEIPGTFVHRDSLSVSFMTINPLTRGHLLVLPIEEIDQWSNMSRDLIAHLFGVAATIGKAQQLAFKCERVGLVIAGFEIPHCHLHLIPTNSMADLNFDRAAKSISTHELESAANQITAAMKELEQGL
ncbi:MAG: HIT family protein [Ilumatobacteraceae bacterium]